MDNFTIINTTAVHQCDKKKWHHHTNAVIPITYMMAIQVRYYDALKVQITHPSPVNPNETCSRSDHSLWARKSRRLERHCHSVVYIHGIVVAYCCTNVSSWTIIYRRLYTVTSPSGTGNKVHTHTHTLIIYLYVIYI